MKEEYKKCAKCVYGYKPQNQSEKVYCTHENIIEICKKSVAFNCSCVGFQEKEEPEN